MNKAYLYLYRRDAGSSIRRGPQPNGQAAHVEAGRLNGQAGHVEAAHVEAGHVEASPSRTGRRDAGSARRRAA